MTTQAMHTPDHSFHNYKFMLHQLWTDIKHYNTTLCI